MKNIRTSITELNVARSSDCSKEKSEEIKGIIIQDFLPYAELEEELGVNLITLFKALKNGVYMLTKCFDIVYCKCPKIVHYKCGWKMLVHGAVLSLTTYGKTWALTKEELETK